MDGDAIVERREFGDAVAERRVDGERLALGVPSYSGGKLPPREERRTHTRLLVATCWCHVVT